MAAPGLGYGVQWSLGRGGPLVHPSFSGLQDVLYMFGVVGIPVTEIAMAAQELGIRYIGMRNEQAVSSRTWAVGVVGGHGCPESPCAWPHWACTTCLVSHRGRSAGSAVIWKDDLTKPGFKL